MMHQGVFFAFRKINHCQAICHTVTYHTDSLDVMPRLNSASIPPLDQGHDDANEEKHLALLHTEGKIITRSMSIYV